MGCPFLPVCPQSLCWPAAVTGAQGVTEGVLGVRPREGQTSWPGHRVIFLVNIFIQTLRSRSHHSRKQDWLVPAQPLTGGGGLAAGSFFLC